jgi:superfamily II DNA/RNA helicase
MDVPNVELVVNYDSTPFIQTYVHRVGRTARAGAEGVAVTLLTGKEVPHFKEMLRSAQNSRLQPFPAIADSALAPLIPTYQRSLALLKAVMDDEKRGALKPFRPLHLHRKYLANKQAKANADAAAAAASTAPAKSGHKANSKTAKRADNKSTAKPAVTATGGGARVSIENE